MSVSCFFISNRNKDVISEYIAAMFSPIHGLLLLYNIGCEVLMYIC